MMHRKLLLCLLCSVTLLMGVLARVGHVTEPVEVKVVSAEEPSQSSTKSQVAAPAKVSAADLERAQTLAELQQELGGSLLEGTLLNEGEAPNVKQEFVDAVQRQQCESRYQQLLDEPETIETDPLMTHAPGQPFDLARFPQSYSDTAEPDLAAVLRTAGRHLDTHANDLEDAGDYDQGDELRRLANRLRRVAREYRHDATPSEVAEDLRTKR